VILAVAIILAVLVLLDLRDILESDRS